MLTVLGRLAISSADTLAYKFTCRPVRDDSCRSALWLVVVAPLNRANPTNLFQPFFLLLFFPWAHSLLPWEDFHKPLPDVVCIEKFTCCFFFFQHSPKGSEGKNV